MRLLLAAPALRLQPACSGSLYPSRRSLCPRSHAWPRVTGRWQRGQRGAAPLSMAACHRARSRLCVAPYPPLGGGAPLPLVGPAVFGAVAFACGYELWAVGDEHRRSAICCLPSPAVVKIHCVSCVLGLHISRRQAGRRTPRHNQWRPAQPQAPRTRRHDRPHARLAPGDDRRMEREASRSGRRRRQTPKNK